MAIVFLLFHKVKKSTSIRLGYLSLILLWIAMEYLHLNWSLSWPWLTIGNVFANFPLVVQWYEFTGFLGGSLWVMLVNILMFRIYQQKNKAIFIPIFVILLPFFISIFMFFDFEVEEDQSINVLIVQPNVDPYIDKFSEGYRNQLADLINLAKTKLSKDSFAFSS